jgi:phosphatidylglycerol:prolipoprotein diacylglycerol transferase
MYPRLFSIPEFDLAGRHLGPLTLYTYGVLLAAAFLAGLWVAGRQARKEGLNQERVTDLAVYLLIAGLIGAKLLLLATDWSYYSNNPRQLLTIMQSGGVFYGGLLAALPVAWWYVRRHGLPGWQTADAAAPAVAIGQAIGRLGCLAAGCCFGTATNVPWAITFTDLQASRIVGTPLDTPLHPVQLYESLVVLGIYFLLLWIARRKSFHGQVVVSYLVLYAVARFVLEYFRGDLSRGTVLGGLLSTSQFISILVLFGVALVLPYLLKKQRIAPAAA